MIKNFQKHFLKYLYFALFIFFAFLIYVVYQIFIPNKYIPVDKVFNIEQNQNGEDIFIGLKQEGFIKSVFWAKVVNKINFQLGKDKFYRGQYTFDKNDSLYNILFKITKRPDSLAVLIPEGFTKVQVADRLQRYIKKFDRKLFLEKAEEGYLFPDTYYFYEFSTTTDILDEFTNNFNKTMFLKFGKVPTKDQVIIASMLEREARDPEDMKIISGIIQNRLRDGMKLQIDATVLYGKGAWKNRVLYKDLLHESDYNTYVIDGLPIGPISNPGINALTAAMNPKKTNYFYYITGRDGKMYYALTGEEHFENIEKYLR